MNESLKVAVTVAEMARMCGLGRSRFYQLIGTTFPHPVYSVDTRRPFYDQEMQKVCLEVRRRNCGIDGKPILFYAKPVNRAPIIKNKVSSIVPVEHPELIEGLKDLGVTATAAELTNAIKTVFPSGTNGVESSSILRLVFIHLLQSKKGM